MFTVNRITQKCGHAGSQRTSQITLLILKTLLSCIRHTNANQEEQDMQCTVTRDETWFNHVTPVIKRASLMWKNPPAAPERKMKATPSVKKIMATIFWDH